jgi:hypothetical protein
MIKTWIKDYQEAQSKITTRYFKHDLRFHFFIVLGAILSFFLLYQIASLSSFTRGLTVGWIIFQVTTISAFIFGYYLYHRRLKKTDHLYYSTHHLFKLDFISALSVSFSSQSAILMILYRSVINSSILIFCLSIAILSVILSMFFTAYIDQEKNKAFLLKKGIAITVLFIVLVRYVPLYGPLLYGMTFFMSYLITWFIYDIKPQIDLFHKIKIYSGIVYTVFGVIFVLTFAFFFTTYRDYFYQDIQVLPQLNLKKIDDYQSHTHFDQEYTFAIEGHLTYMQRGQEVLIFDENQLIKKVTLPDHYKLLASQQSVRIAHQLRSYVEDSVILFDYDVYEFLEDYALNKVESLTTRSELYGYIKQDHLEIYVMPLRIQMINQGVILDSVRLIPETNMNLDYDVYPVMDEKSIKYYTLKTKTDEQIILENNLYGVSTPWVEVFDDFWLISVSFGGTHNMFIILNPDTLEIVSAFSYFSYRGGYTYFENETHRYVSYRTNHYIYDKNYHELVTLWVNRTWIMFGQNHAFVTIRDVSFNDSENPVLITDTLYQLNMEKPTILGIRYIHHWHSILITSVILFAYVIIDRSPKIQKSIDEPWYNKNQGDTNENIEN